MNKLTISTVASHLAGNFHIPAGEEFSKLFSSTMYNIFEGSLRFLSLTFSNYDILFSVSSHHIEE